MTDYDKAVGNAGTMRIRDDGATVSFWILCSDGATNVGGYTWSGVVNGAAVGGTVSLGAGFGSRQLGAWAVSSAQTVTFHQNATGTSGLGGAADHAASIPRGPSGGPPISAPYADRVYDIKASTALLQFSWRAGSNDGGSPVTGFQTNWALDPALPIGVGSVDTPGQPSTMAPLKPGSQYWCSVRAINAFGRGPWSNTLTFKTLTGAYVSDGASWLPAEVLVSDGASWLPAEVDVSDGSQWLPAG